MLRDELEPQEAAVQPFDVAELSTAPTRRGGSTSSRTRTIACLAGRLRGAEREARARDSGGGPSGGCYSCDA